MHKKLSNIFVVVAIVIIVCPFILEYVFRLNPVYVFRVFGVRYFLDEYWFYIASGFLLVAALLQFPVSEDEAWHCDCGYDLSYMSKLSKQCPECGEETKLEWSPTPGHLPRKTLRRLYWAIFLIIGSSLVFIFGLVIKTINHWASV
jgi:hypothetical protein